MRQGVAGHLFCWLLVLSITCFGEKEATRNQAIGLSARAFDISDLRYGSNSFRLLARFKLLDTAPSPAEGTYDLLWQSNESWREQITLPGYTEVRVQQGDHLRVQRPGLVVPSRLEAVRRLMGFGSTLAIGPNDRITKVKDIRFDGSRARCFVRRIGDSNDQTVCFDASTGVLLGTETSWGTRRTYSDFRAEGTKLFPHHILFYDQGKQRIEVFVEQVSFPKDVNPALFSVTGPAEEFASCADKTSARILI